MLKINLLPAYILERQRIRQLMILFAVLLVVELLAIGAVTKMYGAKEGKLNTDLAEAQQKKAEVEKLDQDAQSEQSKIQPLETKVKFITDVKEIGGKWAKVMEDVAAYTYEKVVYKDLKLTSSTCSISGYTDSTSSCARFYLNFMNCPQFSQVTISGLGGYSSGGGSAPGGAPGAGPAGPTPVGMPGPGAPGAPGGGPPAPMGGPPGGAMSGGGTSSAPTGSIPITLQCTLTQPITVPGLAGSAPAGGMGGPMGPGMAGPGGPPGAAGGPPPGVGMPGKAPGGGGKGGKKGEDEDSGGTSKLGKKKSSGEE